MAEDWSDWIEHDGSGCPVPHGVWVEVEGVNDFGFKKRAAGPASGSPCWTWRLRRGVPVCLSGKHNPIIRYRLRRPPAVQLLVDLAETLPVREREDA